MPVLRGRDVYNIDFAVFVLLFMSVALLFNSMEEPVANKQGAASKSSSNTNTEIHNATMLNNTTPEDDIVNIYTNKQGAATKSSSNTNTEIHNATMLNDTTPEDDIVSIYTNEGGEIFSEIPANADLKPNEDNIFKAGNIKKRSVFYTDAKKDSDLPADVQRLPKDEKVHLPYPGDPMFFMMWFGILVVFILLVLKFVVDNIRRERV